MAITLMPSVNVVFFFFVRGGCDVSFRAAGRRPERPLLVSVSPAGAWVARPGPARLSGHYFPVCRAVISV